MRERDFFIGIALLGLLIKEQLVDEVTERIDAQWFAKAAIKITDEVMSQKEVSFHENKYQ